MNENIKKVINALTESESGKKQKKILLINPVCGEYHNFTKKEHTGNNVADIGDLIWGSELNSLSPLIRYLEGCQ